MPYRKHPDMEFNPDIHEEVKPHPKSKGGKTWARKTAIEAEKQAEEVAKLRNLIKQPIWFEKLFKIGEGKKDTAMDVLTEEALEKELESFDYEFVKVSNYDCKLKGEINGHYVEFHGCNNEYNDPSFFFNKFLPRNSIECYIDGDKIEPNDAKKIMEKIFPLLHQRRKNMGVVGKFEQRLKTKKGILDVLGKTQNKNLLTESPKPKQLPPRE